MTASSAAHLGAKHAMMAVLSVLGYRWSGVGTSARMVGATCSIAALAVGAT
jgi:hypothetical protein